MILVYTTFFNKKEAKEMAGKLLKKKLVKCINLFPIESIYYWKQKVNQGKETAAIIKTQKKNFRKVEKFLLENHSYSEPCIIEIPVERVTEKYLKWLKE